MNKFILPLVTSLFGVSSLTAVNVTIGGTTVFQSDGSTALSAGSFISVGYFDGSFSDFAGLSARTWADINTADYTEIFNSTLSSAGEWAGGASPSGISGQKLYAWTFDSLVAPTNVNSQEYGLFTGSDAEWTARGDSPFPPEFNNLTVSLVDTAVLGSTSGGNISLAAVPEPSTYAGLSGLLVLGYVIVRRRK